MIKRTEWQPDTCDCVLEYEWDDATPDNLRVHTLRSFSRRCVVHEGLGMDESHHQALVKESQARQDVLNHIRSNVPKLLKQVITADGASVNDIDPSTVQISFTGRDATRKLVVDLSNSSLTPAEKLVLKVAAAKLKNSSMVSIT